VVAIKLVSKEQIAQLGKMRHVFREKDLLFELKSQYVIELLATTMDEEYLYFIFENCENGDLAGLISQQRKFSLDVCKIYGAQIIQALERL
jgi:serine/threonine protein kinase